HIPGQVVSLLKSMLAVEPADRPQSARELLPVVRRCNERFNPKARSRRKRFALSAAGAASLIAGLSLGVWWHQHRQSSVVIDRSIAVLPFENLSGDKENAYFAEAIQAEILMRLSKIADLKVISRTSTQHYKSKPENLPEIAKQLSVAHVLEGRVQKSAGAVPAHEQLSKVANSTQ